MEYYMALLHALGSGYSLMPMSLAPLIDHTLLKPEATPDDVAQLTAEAVKFGMASVCVNGVYVPSVRAALDHAGQEKPHSVRACAVAGFPLGCVLPLSRAIEATQLAKAGAQEIDVVAWLPQLLARDSAALRDDLLQTTRAVRAVSAAIVVKVILETAALRALAKSDADFEAMIAAACEGARAAGCDFVKTSTGFHPAGGATVEAVKLMKKHAAGALRVKASGGIRTRDDAQKMVDAGADRLGCSASVAILTGGAGKSAY